MSIHTRRLQRHAHTLSAPPLFNGKKVAMIGDSLSVQSVGYGDMGYTWIPDSLVAAGWPSKNSSSMFLYACGGKATTPVDNNGLTTFQNIDQARAQIGEPDLWIIELMANDELMEPPLIDEFPANVQAIFDKLGPNAKVAWINSAFGYEDALTPYFNNTIRTMVEGRPHTALIDWSGYMATYPQDGLWNPYPDWVHMTEYGYGIRNKFIAEESIKAYARV